MEARRERKREREREKERENKKVFFEIKLMVTFFWLM